MPVLPLSHGFGGDADAMLMTTDSFPPRPSPSPPLGLSTPRLWTRAACANSIVSVLPTLQLPDDKTLLTTIATVHNLPSNNLESLGSPHCKSG